MNLLQAFGQGQATFRSQYVSPSAQALYCGIISTMNDQGWKAENLVVNQNMLARVGNLTAKSSIKKYVNELVLSGLIRIKVLSNDDITAAENGKIAIWLIDKTPARRAFKKTNNNNNKQQQPQQTSLADLSAAVEKVGVES